MNSAILCFVIVSVLIGQLSVVPYDPLLLAGVPLASIGLVLKNTREVSAGFLAVALAAANAATIRDGTIPHALEGKDLIVEGVVSSLPQPRERLTRFQFDVLRFPGCANCAGIKRISLSWYGDNDIRPGQRWRLTVRLNRPRGSVNPGLFDYEGWLFSRGINATGYVRGSEALGHELWRVPHHQLRYWLRKHIETTLDDSRIRGLLVALTLGESSNIMPKDWKILSHTGTNHLFIISGLHVGLITVLFYRLFLFAGVRHSSAGLMSLGAALVYGGIAGMGLPVQRALMMTTVAMAGIILNRKIPARTLYCFALLGVTLINPLAFLSAGFWLSFGAVFSLLFVFAGQKSLARPSGDWMRKAIFTQWVVFVGMLPLLLFHVFQVSVFSFLINMVAIPWIGVLVVPALLFGTAAVPLSETLFVLCFRLGEWTLGVLWQLLSWVAEQQWVYFAGPVGLGALIFGFLGACLLLAPRGWVPRWPGLVLLLPLFTAAPAIPERGALEVTILDVGQGLGVVMRTREGAVLYDAGPRFGARFDAGEQIVTPYIRRLNTTILDAFILSHMDNDHAGGAQAVLNNFIVNKIWSSDPHQPEGAISCTEGSRWAMDNVKFRLIELPPGAKSKNDRSCVLLVEGVDFAILLPGDIEAATERQLLDVPLPEIDVMIAPHHGSRSSSSPAFLNHVMADTVVVSAGYNNRFSHPDPDVVNRYRARHASVLTTATEGAITILFSPEKGYQIRSARRQYQRFWHDTPTISNGIGG
ncbi:MAG: DNA internalization-related competence protein ComEC/Rec2 [Pseudomonadales bacterium]